MRSPSIIALAASFSVLGGCTNIEPLGTAGACFAAASDDPENPVFERDEKRHGIRVVAAGEETAPPEEHERCARGMPVQAEFVDDNDEHFWLAVAAHHGSTELIPREIFSLVDGADLTVRQTRGWNNSDTIFLSRGGQPILALQAQAALEGDLGALRVDDNGASALASWGSCGSITAHGLKLTDDNGSTVAANGETVELVVGGVEMLGTNIYSVEYAWSGCTDGPSPANQVTWVAADNSL